MKRTWRRYKLWKRWCKHSLDGRLNKFFILLDIIHSPAFEYYAACYEELTRLKKGIILRLGISDTNGYFFLKDSNVAYPETVLINKGLEEPYDTPEHPIGVCDITRKGDDFLGHADVLDEYLDDSPDGKYFVAGIFDRVNLKKTNHLTVITDARLRYIGLIPKEESAELSIYLEKSEEE